MRKCQGEVKSHETNDATSLAQKTRPKHTHYCINTTYKMSARSGFFAQVQVFVGLDWCLQFVITFKSFVGGARKFLFVLLDLI